MFVGFFRTTTFALQNVSRNLWLSLITVFLMVLTTFSITVVVSLNIIGQQVIRAVEDKVDINLYFYTATSQDDVLKTQNFLQNMNEVSDVVYISPEEALKQFREKHKDDQKILASLDQFEQNILPASLVVHAKNIADYPTIMSAFDASAYRKLVDKANYNDNQTVIQTVSQITKKAYEIGIGVSAIFIIISIIVIFNTMRITIYSHREEVGIMKLVGATNWFIRAPFILEGMLLGAVAAVCTLAIFYLLLLVSNPAVTAFFAGYDFSLLNYFIDHMLVFVAFEVLFGVVLSVVSSMVAITRYLQV